MPLYILYDESEPRRSGIRAFQARIWFKQNVAIRFKGQLGVTHEPPMFGDQGNALGPEGMGSCDRRGRGMCVCRGRTGAFAVQTNYLSWAL